MKSSTKKRITERLAWSLFIIIFAFAALLVQLVNVQVVQSSELSEKQNSYMYSNISLTASRGKIYDRDMNVLAQDVSCSKVYAFPLSVEDPAEVSSFLSEKLGLDYESVYAKLSNKENKYVVIKSKVENKVALEIEKADYSGIEVEQDQSRCYTDPTFAQYVLGFTGADHTGLYGIEATFNSVLAGEPGIKTILTDSGSRVIESSSRIKKEPKQGDSVVLTLDSVLQYYAESAAYEAYLRYSPKRVMVIVSDVNTNEILAMAVNPAYSLDDPWTVNADFYSSYFSEGGYDLSDQQLQMWNNPFTSFIYEPGSTFKIITASSALEENVVNLDSGFYCPGYTVVSGVQIACHVYPNSHGSENLTDAIANSCNPALVQIANLMGSTKFYNYIYNYGFGEKTGITLDGEEAGILSSNQNVNPVDFATLSFGQGLGVTPMQMLQALNAAVNGGYLICPSIVDKIVDSNTGEEVYNYEPQVIRQVISEDTSATMRGILHETASRMSVFEEYADYGLLGKTGTAQKYMNGVYASGKYVTSFYGAVPYDDPQISVLVIMDEPGGYPVYGSTTAAPVGGKVLTAAYDYLAAKDKINLSSLSASGTVIPDVRGQNITEAVNLLNTLGIKYRLSGDENGTVTDQDLISAEYMEGMVVQLTVSDAENYNSVIVPNVKGMTVQKADEVMQEVGVVMESSGGGIAVYQDIEPGTSVERGTVVKVKFEYIE